MALNLRSKLNFGKYKGLTIAEVMNEYDGFNYLLWVIENLDRVKFASDTENYIRKTIELRQKDKKLNPQNYLHEKTLNDLKEIALAVKATLTGGNNKEHYINAIRNKVDSNI